MTDVFLSYSRSDQERSTRLAQVLEQQGYSVWRDIDIPPTVSFDDYIRERLDDCKCVVVLWSPASARSDYVRGEARAAIKNGKLISVAIDPWSDFEKDVPLDFHGREHADLSRWHGEVDGHEFQLVLKAIESLTSGPPQMTGTGKTEHKSSKRPLVVATLFAVGLLAAGAIYVFDVTSPAADCSVEATVARLNAVPAGVPVFASRQQSRSFASLDRSAAGIDWPGTAVARSLQ